MKIMKFFLAIGLLLIVAGGAGLWIAKNKTEKPTQEQTAQNKTAEYIQKSKEYKSLGEKLTNATLYAYRESKKDTTQNGLHLLADILKQQGFNVEQWDIVAPQATKRAIVVKVEDNSYKYLDPIDGVIAMYENAMIVGPYAARSFVSDGTDYRSIFMKLDEGSDVSFYEDFAHTIFAPPGYPLYINVAAPVLEEPLLFGTVDGKAEDVSKATGEWDLTRYFDYFGKKFDEHVMRRVYFTEAAKITFILTGDIDPSSITANIKPEIDGRKLVFKVPEDAALVLEDNKSTASKMENNFIPVDQIIIERL